MSDALTFDTGALIGIERGTSEMASLVRDLVVMKMPVFIPAGVLAQVFRGTARQHALNAFLKLGNVHIVPLDTATAMRAGILCGESETSDIVDASVVICAHEHGGTKVVTSDPDELTHLDPKLRIVPL